MKSITKFLSLCCASILLISSLSMAASVSENDGSAFITKAEFDSLKNTFQSQIDSYNNGIDNKIDSAIASYIAGISVSSTTELTNMYDELGGTNIKWCWKKTMDSPTIEPIAGLAVYFLNAFSCYSYYAGFPSGEGSWTAISSPTTDSEWVKTSSATKMGATIGQFLTYDKVDSTYKCLTNYKKGYLQNTAQAYWWTSGYGTNEVWVDGVKKTVMHYDCYWSGMFTTGNGTDTTSSTYGPLINSPITTTGNNVHIDCSSAYVNERIITNTDYSKWVCPWNVATSADNYAISNEEYKRANKKRNTYGVSDCRLNFRGTQPSVKFSNPALTNAVTELKDACRWDWKMDSKSAWSTFCPGFYSGKDYTPLKLYEGVYLFKSTKAGEVEISKFKLNHESGGTNYVYFAISNEPFSNAETLKGTVELTSKGSAENNVTANKSYKIKNGVETTIKFKTEANKTYYIKIQPGTTINAGNDKYATMTSGAKIKLTIS